MEKSNKTASRPRRLIYFFLMILFLITTLVVGFFWYSESQQKIKTEETLKMVRTQRDRFRKQAQNMDIWQLQEKVLLQTMISNMSDKERRTTWNTIDSLAKALLQDKKYTEAVLVLENFINLYQEVCFDHPKWFSDARGNFVVYLLFDGQYRKATIIAERAAEKDSSNLNIQKNLALAYLYDGQYERGSRIFYKIKEKIDNSEHSQKIPMGEALRQEYELLIQDSILPPKLDRERIQTLLQK